MTQHSRVTTANQALHEDDILQSLQNIPSNFDLALNGSTRRFRSPNPTRGRNERYVSPNPIKDAEVSLLDPEAFRRLSISTISSLGRESRGVSPFPAVGNGSARTWKKRVKDFWQRNHGLFLVSISQLFGALMNVATRLLELEGEGMHPFQVIFARMIITVFFCCLWMWKANVPHFPIGAKGIRLLLVARGLSGFFGIFGTYYSLQYLSIADAVVLQFLAPSVASYACYLFLREPFPRSSQYASLISLLGVILIARPFSGGNTPTSAGDGTGLDADFPTPTSGQRLSAVAVAMLGVLGTAGAFTSIRWVSIFPKIRHLVFRWSGAVSRIT